MYERKKIVKFIVYEIKYLSIFSLIKIIYFFNIKVFIMKKLINLVIIYIILLKIINFFLK